MAVSRSKLGLAQALLWTALSVAHLVLAPALASADDRSSDFQVWEQLDLATALPKRMLFELNLQVHRNNQLLADNAGSTDASSSSTSNTSLTIRPMFGYQPYPWMSVGLGYVYYAVLYSDPAVRSTKNVSEHRLSPQLVATHSVGTWAFRLRTRVEARYRSRGPGSPEQSAGETSWAMRFRQLAQVTFTVREDEPWLLLAWDEILVNLNTTDYVTEPGFAQNRAFAGVGYTPDRSVLLELGYLNQYARSYTDRPDTVSHVLYSSVKLRFDLSDDG